MELPVSTFLGPGNIRTLLFPLLLSQQGRGCGWCRVVWGLSLWGHCKTSRRNGRNSHPGFLLSSPPHCMQLVWKRLCSENNSESRQGEEHTWGCLSPAVGFPWWLSEVSGKRLWPLVQSGNGFEPDCPQWGVTPAAPEAGWFVSGFLELLLIKVWACQTRPRPSWFCTWAEMEHQVCRGAWGWSVGCWGVQMCPGLGVTWTASQS